MTAFRGVKSTSTELACDIDGLHEPFPLTDVQHAYWIGRQGLYEISNVATHLYLELDGTLDPERLNTAWSTLIEVHPMLRTEFLEAGGQRILAEAPQPFHIDVVDLRDCTEQERESRIQAVRRRLSRGAPPLDAWPQFEIVLHLLPGGGTRLHFNIDMMIVDAYSVRLLFDHWGRLYADPTRAAEDEIDITFRDYYLAEQRHIASEAGDASREYWGKRVETMPLPPELPRAVGSSPDLLREPTFSHRYGELAAGDWNRLKERAQGRGLSPASVLAAAFAETLALWSTDPRFAINITAFRRFPLHPRIREVVADFTSTVLLGVDWTARGSFEERALGCATQLWSDMDHPHVSGIEVLRQMSQARGRTVLNPIVFTCALGDLGDAVDWAGDLVHHASETSQVSLDNRLQEYRGKLLISWDTLDELYPPGLIDTMHAYYCDLLLRLSQDESAWTSDSATRLPPAQEEARREANATTGEVPAGLLQGPFLHRARQQPDQIAVIADDGTLTYGQLLARIQALANELGRAGATLNTPIAVVTRPGCGRVIAPLGVLEAGAPYVPIDPGIGAERLSVMFEDAGVRIAVTTSDLDASLGWPAGVRRVLVDRLDPGSVPSSGTRASQSPDDTAYIIYTSGSTGRPKGVAIDHRGPLNTIVDVTERFAIGAGDRVLALSNLSFDLSVYDVFGVLGAGGTLIYPPLDRLGDPVAWAETVERHDVTLWNTVPLLYSELVDAAADSGSSLDTLRLVLMSGDWIPLDLPGRSRALHPAAQLISLGGATEASIWSIYYPIDHIEPAWRSVPYGKPLRNQRFHVLGAALNPCPDWVEGDLYIGGIGLAQGYWRDEERTRASFLEDPKSGDRLYRTGDRGRYLPDGNIEFLGREDRQVKIRGFRVELGDVESNLSRHPDIRDCYVLLSPFGEDGGATPGPGNASRSLVAYVVAVPGRTPEERLLRTFLTERLPDYMVPSRIVVLDRIPTSSNGKVDLRALPGLASVTRQTPHAPPSTDTERTIARIWSDVLNLPAARLGVHDAFFDLGGDSLLLARVHRKLSAAFPNRQMQIVQLFVHETIAALARLIDGEGRQDRLDLDRIREQVNRKRTLRRDRSGA